MFNKDTVTLLGTPTPGTNRSDTFLVHASDTRLVTWSIIDRNCRRVDIDLPCIDRAICQRDVD